MRRFVRAKIFLVGGIFVLLAPVAHAGLNPSVIEAAKSEGKMSYYTTMTLSQSKKVVDALQKKYPFITPELLRGGGDEVLNRIQNEARGGLFAWDVVSTRGDSVLTFEESKLITPYRSPESKFVDKDMVDDDGYWTAYYVNPYVLGYNTKLVKKEEAPKTWRIPVREDVDADPPRLFKGYKRIVEHPEDYKDFNTTVTLYQQISGIR